MIDHRRIQRTLLRSQVDADFAARLLAGEDAAVASTGLGPEELALFEGVDPAALHADPGGRRRTQILGNAASEYTLSLAAAGRFPGVREALSDFLASPEFHTAMAAGGRLPVAFGEHAARRLSELGAPAAALAGLVALERTMVRARREPRDVAAPARGELVRVPRAHLVRVAAGTLDWAGSIRARIDAGREAPLPGRSTDETEVVLVLAAEPTSSHRLPEIHAEVLQPAVAALLELARAPLPPAARARLARDLGAEPADLEEFADGLVADGILARG